MATFRAKYHGKCSKCSCTIAPGAMVSWSRRQRGIIYHAECTPSDVAPAPEPYPEVSPASPAEAPTTPLTGPGIGEDRVRAIAHEVSTANDAEMIGNVLTAVDKRIRAERPVILHLRYKPADEKPTDTTVENGHAMLGRLVYLIESRMHAYLAGDPGSGKSTGAIMSAKALGMRYGYTSLNPMTPESRLLGFIDAGGVYRETEFYRCYTQGGVFCIDELDNGHPATLNTLNGMLESDADGIGRGAFPCGVVERHRDFVCVATGNTNGRGGDRLFPERRALDSAFLDRFAFLRWDYDLALEKVVTFSINPDAGAWLAWIHAVRAYCKAQAIRLWVTPRASYRGARMLADGQKFTDMADMLVFKGLDPETVARILADNPLPAA